MSIYKKKFTINLKQTYDRTYDNLKTTNEVSDDNNFEIKTKKRLSFTPTLRFQMLLLNKLSFNAVAGLTR